MIRDASPILAATLTVALAACGSNGTGQSGTGGASGGSGNGGNGGNGEVTCNGTTLSATQASNYLFTSTISLPVVKVKPNTAIDFDWSESTTDLLGHPVDPKKDLNTISVIEWNLKIEDLQTKLNADELTSRDMTVQAPILLTTDGNATSVNLLKMTMNNIPIGVGAGVTVEQVMLYFDPSKYDPASHVFTVMAASGTVIGM
jgi:hypothetical protein